MKSQTKAWAGIVLLAAGLTSSPVWFTRDAPSNETSAGRVRSGRESTPNRGPGQAQKTSFSTEQNRDRDEFSHKSDRKRTSGVGQNEATGALPAVRLANDFPLPAAIVSNYRSGNRERSSSEMRQAEEDIAAQFYTEVARQAVEVNGASTVKQVEEAEGPTVIVSPDADNARTLQRANERFRALFGNEAYNQASMQSIKEARLSMPLEVAE